MRLRIERLKPRLLIPGLFHVRSGQIPTIARAALGKNAEKSHDITDLAYFVCRGGLIQLKQPDIVTEDKKPIHAISTL